MKEKWIKGLKGKCILIGFLLSVVLMIPYLILGADSIVIYHDQLDGELMNYILAAKYLFTDIHIYAELMSGIPSTGVLPPAILFVPLYKIFSPFVAFLITQWCISFVGFVGMYLLLEHLTKRQEIAVMLAALFMLLPFYPVYGLCIPGQPLLFYICLKLHEKKCTVTQYILYYGYIFLYSLGSSLVLVGFACILFLLTWAFIYTISCLRKKKPIASSLWISAGVLIFGYGLSNLSLIKQILFPSSENISHKTEVVHSSMKFIDGMKEILYPGTNYTQTWHIVLLPLAIVVITIVVVSMVMKQKDAEACATKLKKAAGVFLFILLFTILYSIYNGTWITALKNSTGSVFSSFNLGRIVWLLPVAWFILAAYLFSILMEKPYKVIRYIAAIFAIGIWGIFIFMQTPLKSNVAKIVRGNDYYAMDWNKFFAQDIFAEIDEAINLPKEDYRVVSLGIYPAAALYNGFYCLDGYSNNYPLAYKHEFRQVMAEELGKNDYIRQYFDEWGNRCYITTAQYANYYTMEKKWNAGFADLYLNTDKLKEMGCKYIFAASYITNAEELGLKLFREEPFATEGSWYNIYVYEIN